MPKKLMYGLVVVTLVAALVEMFLWYQESHVGAILAGTILLTCLLVYAFRDEMEARRVDEFHRKEIIKGERIVELDKQLDSAKQELARVFQTYELRITALERASKEEGIGRGLRGR
jgi:hypothetical protein